MSEALAALDAAGASGLAGLLREASARFGCDALCVGIGRRSWLEGGDARQLARDTRDAVTALPVRRPEELQASLKAAVQKTRRRK